MLPIWYMLRAQRQLWVWRDGGSSEDLVGPGRVETPDAMPLAFRIDADAPGWQSARTR